MSAATAALRTLAYLAHAIGQGRHVRPEALLRTPDGTFAFQGDLLRIGRLVRECIHLTEGRQDHQGTELVRSVEMLSLRVSHADRTGASNEAQAEMLRLACLRLQRLAIVCDVVGVCPPAAEGIA